MRLVLMLSYDGGYECGSFEKILPIEYADKDTALFELSELLDAHKKAWELFRKEQDIWYSERPRLDRHVYSGKNPDVLEKRERMAVKFEIEFRKWADAHPLPIAPGHSIKFAGHELSTDEMSIDGILTLDEWFSACP